MTPEHYQNLETSAVLFERDMVWLTLTGPDRVTWLQGMVSNDVGRLRAGQGCLAAHLTPQGKVLAILTVLMDSDQLWILSERQTDRTLRDQLDRLLIMEDASIEDRSGAVRVYSMAGPRCSAVLGEMLGAEVSVESRYDHAMIGWIRVIRSLTGYDLVVPADGVDRLKAAAAAAGVPEGGEPLRSVLWIEAGIPRWGVDVDERVTRPELGEDAIDYAKGCYIGQEAVAKIKYLGHVNRRLMGLRIEGDRVPDAGTIQRGSREVGRLTSAVHSPAAGGVIGLAYLRRGADSPGTEVEIARDGETARAVVVDLPFVERRADDAAPEAR
jgi:folate-binding protein YgfZ